MNKEIEDFAVAILKPDTGRDVLTPCLIKEIEERGGLVVKRKEIKITPEQAAKIYSEYSGLPKFGVAVKSLVCGESDYCTVLIIFHPVRSAIDLLREVKGKAMQSGIRKKFLIDRVPDLKKRGMTDSEIEIVLARNRVHCPDSSEEVASEILLLFSENELRELEGRYPNFSLKHD